MGLWDIIDWINKMRGVIDYSADSPDDAFQFIRSGLIEKLKYVGFAEAKRVIEKMDWTDTQFAESPHRIEENSVNDFIIRVLANAIDKGGFGGRIDISYKTHNYNQNCADIQLFIKDEEWVVRYLCWRIYSGRAFIFESVYDVDNLGEKPDERARELFYPSDNQQTKKQKRPSIETFRSTLLYSDNLDERIEAIHLLSQIKSKEALLEVLETLMDKDGEIVLHASLALATFGKDAVNFINSIKNTWSTEALHPSGNNQINLRERLLYPLALLQKAGKKLLKVIMQTDEEETVRTTAEDLLYVLNSPIDFTVNTITAAGTCEHLEWNLPPAVKHASRPISMGAMAVNNKVLSVIAVLCAQQGLFGTGLRGSQPVDYYYDMSTEVVRFKYINQL